jgi:hypothetical protein
MHTRKLVRVTTKVLVVFLAITLQLSAQGNPSHTFKRTTHDARGDRSRVIVYSDSLADNGNIYKLLGFPGPPYWQGRASNGPMAIEDMAAILGMPLLDYAYDAATTGVGNLIDGGDILNIPDANSPTTTASTMAQPSLPDALRSHPGARLQRPKPPSFPMPAVAVPQNLGLPSGNFRAGVLLGSTAAEFPPSDHAVRQTYWPTTDWNHTEKPIARALPRSREHDVVRP